MVVCVARKKIDIVEDCVDKHTNSKKASVAFKCHVEFTLKRINVTHSFTYFTKLYGIHVSSN